MTMPVPDQDVRITREDAVLRITLARPAKRNALTVAMYAAMADALEQAAADESIRVVIFTAEGVAFTAGNDLADFVSRPPAGEDAPVSRFLRAIATAPAILIAVVQGRAVGVGTTMLLHCDFVVAEEDAELHMPFVDLALVPEAASSLLVPQLVGQKRAARLLLLGEKLAAREALALDFVSELAPAGGGLAAAEALTAKLLAKPAGALRLSKALMKSPATGTLQRMAEEGAAFAAQLQTAEFQANVAAFFASKSKAA